LIPPGGIGGIIGGMKDRALIRISRDRSPHPALWLVLAIGLSCCHPCGAATAARESGDPVDLLASGFAAPPAAARPWVYWFPLGGNLTREGITADLEAMARAGIGGVLYMEVDQGAPKGPADFAGPSWRELFRHACDEASRLRLEINMNNDAGWCGSGGPWITPELSMQKIVWSETFIDGGRQFEGALPRPPAVRDFYRDIAVLAFPMPPGEDVRMADASPVFSSSGTGKKPGQFSLPHPEADKPQFVQVEFPRTFTARLMTADFGGRHPIHGRLEVSDDGRNFRQIKPFAAGPPLALTFEATTARYFRLTLTHHNDSKRPGVNISNINLSPRHGIERLLGKASFTVESFPPAPARWPDAPEGVAVPRDRIVDLTGKMDASGKIAWDAPPGRWTILRMGHTTTGRENHPAPEPGRGLECDKLSKDGAAAMFQGLMARLVEENRSVTGKGKTLVATHIDSWEVGSQNWTPRMREEFRRLRGYDLLNLMPTFAGRVVDSIEVTERFLWDLRQTVSDLLVENYAGEFRRLANENGLRLSIEAYGEPADNMSYAGRADEPMAEFWSWARFGAANTCTEMASAAHTYGKRILGAEAFTATDAEKWQGHPANIKDLGDWAFCEGINRFVFHRYAAQPWTDPDRAPGMSMGPWGLHYERTQTWWDQTRAWHEYLARCQFLLQQGLFVADVAYLAAEGAPRSFGPPPDAHIAPRIRGGYNFDVCAPEVVLTRMTVKDGRIVMPDGMSYRVLVLPPVETMTPRLLRKIKQLADAGATIVADARPPQKSPSLADMGAGDAEVKKLAGELWPRLITGKTPGQVLAERNVKPDFSSTPNLRHIHRAADGADIYFVANPAPHAADAVASFRVTGVQPEFWWPDSGRMAPALAFQEHDGLTTLPLRLEPSGSVFVIFRGPASPSGRLVSATRDGKELLPDLTRDASAYRPPDAARTFTFVAWARPETDTGLPQETNAGISSHPAGRNDLLYAVPGHEVWTEADAGVGIAVGRNGVCVYEHGAGHFPAVLVFPATVTNWAHVAVVYRDGTPTLYLDGKFARTGLKSRLAAHGGVGVRHARLVAPFNGDCADLGQFDRALSEDEIRDIAANPPHGRAEVRPAMDFARGEIWQGGTYVLKTADGGLRESTVSLPPPQEIGGPWEVRFDPKWGGPKEPTTFARLSDWKDNADPRIKYYSGTATYRTEFHFNGPGPERGKSRVFFLDLGKVAVMAEVRLNGRDLGTLWKPPYCVDVTDALKSDANELEIRAVNLWINRLIGDEQLPEDSDRNANGTLKSWPEWLAGGKPSPTGRITFTTHRLWNKDDAPVESGLIGPVVLMAAERVSFSER